MKSKICICQEKCIFSWDGKSSLQTSLDLRSLEKMPLGMFLMVFPEGLSEYGRLSMIVGGSIPPPECSIEHKEESMQSTSVQLFLPDY